LSTQTRNDVNLTNFIYEHITRRTKRKKEGENLKDVRLAPTRCQNLSISTTHRLNKSVTMIVGCVLKGRKLGSSGGGDGGCVPKGQKLGN